MKKFKTLLIGLLAIGGITSARAENINFQITIDDASHVSVYVGSEAYTLVNGTNDITAPEYASVSISAISPWAIEKVYEATSDYTQVEKCTSTSLYPYGGEHYQITTYNLDDARTATATINIDDPTKVNAMRGGTYERVSFENTTNTYKFDPKTESVLTVSSSDYSVPLYEVKVDGTPVNSSYGTYYVNLTNGCTVDITANVPDKDVTVTFVYGENSKGCISSVSINEESYEDFSADTQSITMKAGQKITLRTNSDFGMDAFKVNGQSTYFYDGYNQLIMDDTEFTFEAHPYGKISVTISVEDPSTIIVGKGAYNISYCSEILTLQSGDNEVELSENNSIICWGAAAGCYIEEVEVDGILQGTYDTYATLVNGSTVKFKSGKIVMDKTAVMWIDNKEAVDTYFNLQGQDRNSIPVESGYNVIPFYEGMIPMDLSWYSENNPVVGKVYINNMQARPQYEDGTSYSLYIEDGDVVKVFFAAEPVECNVTFEVDENVTLSATTDRITPVADLTAALTVFAGTEVALSHMTDDEITVKVNDTELTPGEDGLYTFTVTGPTTVKATPGEQDGIREISSQANGTTAVFDLQGRRVSTPVKGGIYIVNGHKTLVK